MLYLVLVHLSWLPFYYGQVSDNQIILSRFHSPLYLLLKLSVLGPLPWCTVIIYVYPFRELHPFIQSGYIPHDFYLCFLRSDNQFQQSRGHISPYLDRSKPDCIVNLFPRNICDLLYNISNPVSILPFPFFVCRLVTLRQIHYYEIEFPFLFLILLI